MPDQPDITAILVSIENLRGEVRAALADISRHAGSIEQLFSQHNALRDRVSRLEASGQAQSAGWSKLWGALAAVSAAAAVVLAVLLAVHGN